MRYAVKGSNTADVTGCSGAALVALMGRNNTTGRAFWLKRVWYPPHSTTGKVILFNATVGTMATAALAKAATAHAVIYMLSATEGATADGRGLGGYMQFPDPGLKFSIGCCIAFHVSGSATIGSCGGEGYEE